MKRTRALFGAILLLIVAVVAPVLVGLIFKYFLLVPMPAEGMVVALVDAIWYFEF